MESEYQIKIENEDLIQKDILFTKIEFERLLNKMLTQNEYYNFMNNINRHLLSIYICSINKIMYLAGRRTGLDINKSLNLLDRSYESIISFIKEMKLDDTRVKEK